MILCFGKFVFVLWIIALVGKNKKWRGHTGPWQSKLFLSRLFLCQSRLLVDNWFVGRRSQHYFPIFHGYSSGAAWLVGRRSQHYFPIFHGCCMTIEVTNCGAGPVLATLISQTSFATRILVWGTSNSSFHIFLAIEGSNAPLSSLHSPRVSAASQPKHSLSSESAIFGSLRSPSHYTHTPKSLMECRNTEMLQWGAETKKC